MRKIWIILVNVLIMIAMLTFDFLKLDMKFVHDMFKNDKTLKMGVALFYRFKYF